MVLLCRRARETGERLDVEITPDKGIFEYVDDKEYSKIVRKRQADTWVMDEDDLGYADDGRELFDEEHVSDEDNSEETMKSKGNKQPRKKKKHVDKNSIRSMLLKTKPKDEKEITIEGDDILAECLEQANKYSKAAAGKRNEVKFRSLAKPDSISHQKTATESSSKPSPSGFTAMRERPVWTPSQQGHSRVSSVHKQSSLVTQEDRTVIEYPDVEKPPSQQETSRSHVAIENQDNGSGVTSVTDSTSAIKTESQDFDNFEMDFADFEAVDSVKPEPMEEETNSVCDVKQELVEECETKGRLWEEGWETIKQQVVEESPPVVVDPSQLPITTANGESVLQFYWIDAYEDAYSQPGTVFLFGKVKLPNHPSSYASCCVQVRNIERCLYFLPRKKLLDKRQEVEMDQDVRMEDVYQEFNKSFAEPFKIMKFSSKRVEKKYAFEKTDVPSSVEYLEVKYLAKHRAPPMDSSGRSYSHVFGTNTSSIERLVLSQQIKGPCWLSISQPAPGDSVSWCKYECCVSSPSCVTVMPDQPPMPPLVVVSLNLQTFTNPKTNVSEVLAVGVFVNDKVSMDKPPAENWKRAYNAQFCGIRRLGDRDFPFDFNKKKGSFIEVLPTERALLGFVLAKLHKIDPDVLLGHGLQDFELDVLVHRIQSNKVPNWSKISRLKRSTPVKGRMLTQQMVCGRLVCDVKISSKELIRARSYDLTELVNQVLHASYPTWTVEQTVQAFESTSQLMSLVHHCMDGALACMGIMMELNILPLAYQITRIAGNILSRTLLGGRSERNEYLLLHAFTSRGYICPDKLIGKRTTVTEDDHGEDTAVKSGRRKPAYTGGLVLEPKKGFYDTFILLLDFNSLYPSIIQEYNIDFTTVEGWQLAVRDSAVNLELPSDTTEQGILPSEIRILVNRRREVKNLMKTQAKISDLYQQYDIRQKALKLTANSMYGCLGFSNSRFYAQPLAALITSRGREILSHTKDLVEKMGLEVIYGDTDSIMINTNSKDFGGVMELAGKVKAEVNKFYRLLEIDVDGVYKTLLLLKKKKYAAMCVSSGGPGKPLVETMEMKGLDIVRRDWCNLAKETGQWVLEKILTCDDREEMLEKIHEHLAQVSEDVNNGHVQLEKFVITKSLSKAPENYPDAKSLPHVLVATRLISKGVRVQAGDVVPYVICKSSTANDESHSLPAVQRALHPLELKESTDQVIDTGYYLQQQVHAVVTRLCEPIQGTDPAQIAHHLGLDPSHFRSAQREEEDGGDSFVLVSGEDSAERFKECQPLQFPCLNCQGQIMFKENYHRTCQHCKQPFSSEYACIQIRLAVREHIKQYYLGWMYCDDQTCAFRTRMIPLQPHMECYGCGQGHLKTEYTSRMLYDQMCFIKHVLTGGSGKVKTPEADVIDEYLSKNDYSKVNLDHLFEGLNV
jgi:DNA polymerase alpha subunit A